MEENKYFLIVNIFNDIVIYKSRERFINFSNGDRPKHIYEMSESYTIIKKYNSKIGGKISYEIKRGIYDGKIQKKLFSVSELKKKFIEIDDFNYKKIEQMYRDHLIGYCSEEDYYYFVKIYDNDKKGNYII